MTVELPENLQSFVKDQVRSGRFASEQEVMAEAVRALKSRLEQAEAVEAIRRGIADVDAGRTVSLEDFEDEVRRTLGIAL